MSTTQKWNEVNTLDAEKFVEYKPVEEIKQKIFCKNYCQMYENVEGIWYAIILNYLVKNSVWTIYRKITQVYHFN